MTIQYIAAGLMALVLQETKGEDLVPLKAGTTWTFVAQGQEFKIKAAGTEKIGEVECTIFETTIEEKTQKEYMSVTADGLKSHRITAGDRVIETKPAILRIKFPLKKGETWDWAGKQGEIEQKATFTNEGEEEIVTPAGKYKAWKVVAVIEQNAATSTAAYWYAAGTGMVRQDVTINARGKLMKMTTELKAFEAAK